MNPTPQAVAAIRGWVADWSPADATIAASLNQTMVSNPIAQAPQVPAPLSLGALAGLLTDPANNSAARLMDWVNLGLLEATIEAGNRPGLALWVAQLKAAKSITDGEAQALAAYCQSTVPDPNWTAQVPRPLAVLGRLLDAADVAASRPAGS